MSNSEGGQVDINDTDHKYPTAAHEAFALQSDVPHNVNGHTGFRCIECARESPVMVSIVDDGGDYWQNVQIQWQEECDKVMSAFDEAVAIHFPVHQPQNCQTCPVKPILPEKPNPPVERRHKPEK